jgi:hypothetical protein
MQRGKGRPADRGESGAHRGECPNADKLEIPSLVMISLWENMPWLPWKPLEYADAHPI